VTFPSLAALDAALTDCRACPRLVAWREQVAAEKRAAYRDEEYWGRPVPGIGPPDAPLLLVGLALYGTRITAPVHCAPPDNKPTPDERDRCGQWLSAELDLLAPTLRAVVVLGAFGWQALLPVLGRAGWVIPRPRPAFGHSAHVTLAPAAAGRRELQLFGSYHVSQQNTFTGKLTPAMLEEVLGVAAHAADLH
jgi:uracil-DNA glycosylase